MDNSLIDSDLSHFPIPVVLGTSVGQTNSDVSDIFDEIGSNSLKIAITKSDGVSQVYGEVEEWDPVNKKGLIWVSKSDLILSSSEPTNFYIYYDSNQSDNTDFIGTSGNSPDFPETTPFTVSSIINLNSLAQGESNDIDQGWVGIVDKYKEYYNTTLGLWVSDDNCFSFTTGNGDWDDLKTNTIVADEWYHVASVWDGTNKYIYLNGNLVNTDTPTTDKQPCSGAGNLWIGGRNQTNQFIYASIDSVQISNIPRSADWIKVNYNGQIDNLLQWGATELM